MDMNEKEQIDLINEELDRLRRQTDISAANVPYIVHEGEVARLERAIKRLIIAIVIMAILLAGTNLAWLYYESQFETITLSQDGAGLNNVNTGSQGDLINGAEGQD